MANETQKFEFSAVPTGGEWKPVFEGNPSSLGVGWDSNASVLANRLEEIAALTGNIASVTGDYSSGFTVEFGGSLANTDVSTLSYQDNTLTIAGNATFATTQEGGGGNNEIQTIVLDATGGTFTIAVSGYGVSSTLNWDCSAGDMQAALNAIFAGLETSVTGGSGSFTIEFVGASADTPIIQMAFNTNSLTKPVSINVTVLQQGSAAAVTLSADPLTIAENGGTSTVTATLDSTHSADVTVDLSFSGTATNNTDYSASSTSILISAGSSTGGVTLTALDDVASDPDETIVVDISSVTNAVENGTQQVTVTITDDDGITVRGAARRNIICS